MILFPDYVELRQLMEESGGMEQGKLASLGEEKITRDTRDSEKVEGQSLEILNDLVLCEGDEFREPGGAAAGSEHHLQREGGEPRAGLAGGEPGLSAGRSAG